MTDRTAIILDGDSWRPARFEDVRTGDLFLLLESDGAEVDKGQISFAVTDADPKPPGSVQAVNLGTMTRDQVLAMVQAIRGREPGETKWAADGQPWESRPVAVEPDPTEKASLESLRKRLQQTTEHSSMVVLTRLEAATMLAILDEAMMMRESVKAMAAPGLRELEAESPQPRVPAGESVSFRPAGRGP